MLHLRKAKGNLKFLAGLFIALIVAPVAIVMNTTPAFAVSCSGYGCDGQDPVSTGCDSGAYTVASDPLKYDAGGSTIGWIDLRYSPTCGTNWARTRSNIGVQSLSASVSRPNSYTTHEVGNYSTAWSGMVYAPSPVVACAWGSVYNASINKFATDYVRDQICY